MGSTYSRFNTAMFKTLEIAGGATTAALTCTGIAADDVLLGAVAFATRTNELASQGSLAAEATLSAAGIQFSTTDTSNMTVVVTWLDISAAEA